MTVETSPADPIPTTVLLVDDHHLFRAGVRAELTKVGAGQVAIVGEASDAESAIELIVERQPQVVLLDVHLGSESGASVVTAVSQAAPEVKFLAISVSDSPEDVISVIRSGARGYVTKTIEATELVAAITRVAAGDAVFSPRLAGFVLDAFATGSTPMRIDEELDQLTPREREVLRLIARGYAYKEVARQLVLSVKTIETHVSSVLRKLQLSNRQELTRWATDRKIV
jgi:DNA-binding NarL/FixJ family response regulator